MTARAWSDAGSGLVGLRGARESLLRRDLLRHFAKSVEDAVIDHARTVDYAPDKGDSERLQKWLESLDPDDMGKYKM